MSATLAWRPRHAPTDTDPLGSVLAGCRHLLDAVGTNVLVADLDLRIVHANRRALATLRGIDGALRGAFGIGADDLLGGSIHRFHPDPQRVEAILDQRGGFHLPHAARFAFGEVALSATIDALPGHDGETCGYLVAWEDISDLLRYGQGVARMGEHLETAASAVEELSASIGEIARSASDAAAETCRGVGDAERTTAAVRELGAASEAIVEVVRTVSTIAEQTNILALNATIEAARAGEAGRGFAVVAGEVKQLARDTTEATDDIRRRIAAIRTSVEEVAAAIEGIGALLGQVDGLQSTVAATVEQQRVATGQLAASVHEAATSSREVVERASF